MMEQLFNDIDTFLISDNEKAVARFIRSKQEEIFDFDSEDETVENQLMKEQMRRYK